MLSTSEQNKRGSAILIRGFGWTRDEGLKRAPSLTTLTPALSHPMGEGEEIQGTGFPRVPLVPRCTLGYPHIIPTGFQFSALRSHKPNGISVWLAVLAYAEPQN